jgi:pimeloyl-ACP methyl ester carboxylesterase
MPRAETMSRTEIKGLSVAYRRAGHGPVIVLLHGFTQDSRVWRQQLDGLSDRFTVIAWDAPGAGQSSDPPADFTMPNWADTLAGLLDAARVPRAHILGLSWGGLLAQEFYRKYPTRVSTLVLVDTYAGWKGSLSESVAQERLAASVRDSALPPKDFIPRYLPGMFSDAPPEGIQNELAQIMGDTHAAGFRVMAKALAEGDTRDLLPTIQAPTLLVWGDADKRSPMKIANQLQQGIVGAKLQVIPGAGHMSNMEAPTAFNAIVREFCLAHP